MKPAHLFFLLLNGLTFGTSITAAAQADISMRPEGFYPDIRTEAEGPVALTFDDGLMRRHTALVLDALKARDLHATFFVSGHTIRRSTWHLIGRMIADGHEIANHSWSHDTRMAVRRGTPADHEAWLLSEIALTQIKVDIALLARSSEEFAALEQQVFRGFREKNPRDVQVRRAPGIYERHAALMEQRGFEPDAHPVTLRWFRPPGGSPYLARGFKDTEIEAFTEATLKARVRIALWHHSTLDSVPGQRTVPELIFNARKAVQNATRNGGVILAHDRLIGKPLHALLDAISGIRDRMMTLDRMYVHMPSR